MRDTIDIPFLQQMVKDEFQELAQATTDAQEFAASSNEPFDQYFEEAKEVDAVLDAVYYMLQHLSSCQVDLENTWKHAFRHYMHSPTNIDDMFGDCVQLLEKSYANYSYHRLRKGVLTDYTYDMLSTLTDELTMTEQVNLIGLMVETCLFELAKTGLDIRPIWNLIHQANMTKFGPGGYLRDDGKWMKPPDFVAPDSEIVNEIRRQRLF